MAQAELARVLRNTLVRSSSSSRVKLTWVQGYAVPTGAVPISIVGSLPGIPAIPFTGVPPIPVTFIPPGPSPAPSANASSPAPGSSSASPRYRTIYPSQASKNSTSSASAASDASSGTPTDTAPASANSAGIPSGTPAPGAPGGSPSPNEGPAATATTVPIQNGANSAQVGYGALLIGLGAAFF